MTTERPAAAPEPRVHHKPYPAYKDSGVEWLGDIPAHWESQRLKLLGSLQGGAGFPDDEQGLLDGEFPFFKVGDMAASVDGKGLSVAPNSVSMSTARRLRAFVLPPGTIVFAKVGAALKLNKRRILTRPSCIDNNMMGFTARGCDVDWVFYWFSGLDLGGLANPGAVPSVNEGQVRAIPVPVPPFPEQRAIAAFLDRETAKIDALVAKKERLIELLQEKRTALISNAVTKGLDPHVPMKDSGVEWLGDIPAHWDIKLLKRLAGIRYGLGQPPPEAADGVPFVRATNVSNGRISEEGMMHVVAEAIPMSRDATLTAGEILVVRSGAYTGDSSIVPEEYAGSIAGYDMVVAPRDVVPEFLAWQLLAPQVRDLQFGFENLRAAQPHLNAEQLGSVLMVLPPSAEQLAIAASLGCQTAQIDSLLANVCEGLERMKEYRVALISAAVTGKIDVRDASLRD